MDRRCPRNTVAKSWLHSKPLNERNRRFFIVFVTLIFSQLFWIGRVLDIGERFIPGKPRRTWLAVIAAVLWAFFFLAYGRDIPYAAYPRFEGF